MMVVGLSLVNPVDWAFQEPAAPPAQLTLGLWLALWINNWSWTTIIFPIFLILQFYPTGRPLSSRWNWLARYGLGMWLVFMFLLAFSPQVAPFSGVWSVANPIGFVPLDPTGEAFIVIWSIAMIALVTGSVASLIVRYRQAPIDQRQQIKWLMFAGAVFLVIFLLAGFILEGGFFSEEGWTDLLLVPSILGLPVAIAIAIFRYHVWDLEVVVNRALIYGLLTTLLAGIFAASIAVTTELGRQLLGEGSRTMGAAVSALVVAGVFQPLRTWIEGKVNERFYPEKIDLASGLVEVQPEFWAFLDQSTLVWVSLEHIRRVLGTSHAAFFLETGTGEFRLENQFAGSTDGAEVIHPSAAQLLDLGRKRVVAAAGLGPITGHVPVYVDRGKTSELLGLLSIGARGTGKGYSGDDLKALAELGGKIGVALKALQLKNAVSAIQAVGDGERSKSSVLPPSAA